MAALSARGALARDGSQKDIPKNAPQVLLLEGATQLGRKILISGGGRCNVTNEHVSEKDFITDSPNVLRHALTEFPVESVIRFFESRGCALKKEALGKLFPVSDRAADVLEVLRRAVELAGVDLRMGHEVVEIQKSDHSWSVLCGNGARFEAKRLLLSTGGKSIPKTGSRGFGFDIAKQLGHELVPTYPALVPLILKKGNTVDGLAGVTVPAILSLVPQESTLDQIAGKKFHPITRAAGSLLVTHRGISGPAALDVSGPCVQALETGEKTKLLADFWTLTREDSPYRPFRDLPKPPGTSLSPELNLRPVDFENFQNEIRALSKQQPRLLSLLSIRLPRRLAEALIAAKKIDANQALAELSTEKWRELYEALVHCQLKVEDSEGFEKAEVTQGGVALSELNPKTLESKLHFGLFFCGEVVNVTGRLGGFNFQWAWSSGYKVGLAML